ncbi:YycH family regulatory protein [Ferdinandcohnia sp. Marseille-Q9671]
MKYESIKTTILIILVLLSIVLTWTLWTYQPQYKNLDGDNLVDEVSANNSRETSGLISPIKILYHINEQHFGTYDEIEINRVMKDIRTWEINDVQNISHNVPLDNFANFIKQNGHVEIHFSDVIPLQIYKSIFRINDKENSSATFDRFVIDVNANDRGEGIVYFISTSEHLIYEGRINRELVSDFKKSHYSTASRYPEHLEYSLSETISLFLPRERTYLNKYDYFIDEIEISTFIDRLFANSDKVKKDELTTAEVHTDGSRLLRVYNDLPYVEFINPTGMGEKQGLTTDLIQTSIDYVNEHVGWTDTYRFFRWNPENQTTVFKLYKNNIPVFDSQGVTEIFQKWDNNEIVRYVHPSVKLQIEWNPIKTSLTNGEKVIEALKALPDFNPELLEYVTIAYELKEKQSNMNELKEKQDNSQFVSLQPIWSYRYNGSWLKVEMKDEEVRGNEDGLE